MQGTPKTPYLLGLLILACAGCDSAAPSASYTTEIRKDKGLVLILPGIEGPSPYNEGIRQGLYNAGVPYALEIYPWGHPVPGAGMLLNQMDVLGDRLAGITVAHIIADYQKTYPGRPVFVIGHSAGGGVSVFTAEALADMGGHPQVDGLVLLSSGISCGYNLNKAMGSCRKGIVNFHNSEDGMLLGAGTAFLGNVDGVHGPSAGKDGFTHSYPNLHQVSVNMYDEDPQGAANRPPYVASNVAPWIHADAWPPGATALQADLK